MSTALVPTFGDRPVTLERDGWTVFVAVHDADYLRRLKDWRDRLRTTHPDHGGTPGRFMAARRKQQKWLSKERCWYASLGLTPPTIGTTPPPLPRRHVPAPKKRPPTHLDRLATLLAGPRPVDLNGVAASLGITRKAARTYICRLRKRGVRIETGLGTRPPTTYRAFPLETTCSQP